MSAVMLILRTYPFLLLRLAVNVIVLVPIVWVFTFGVEKGREWLGVNTVLTDFAFGYCALSLTMLVIDFSRKYINHLIRYAQIASMTDLLCESDEVSFSKGWRTMMTRFGSVSALYFADKLMSKAINQVASWIIDNGKFIPDSVKTGTLARVISSIVKTAVLHVDEVVVSYMYRRPELSVWEGIGKGISLYFQSWKSLLKAAFFSVLWVKVFGWAMNLIVWIFAIWYLWDKGVSSIIIFVLTYKIVAFLVRDTLLHPYQSASMLIGFYEVSKNREPEPAMEEKLSAISESFDSILDLNRDESFSEKVSSMITEGMSRNTEDSTILDQLGKLVDATKKKGGPADGTDG